MRSVIELGVGYKLNSSFEENRPKVTISFDLFLRVEKYENKNTTELKYRHDQRINQENLLNQTKSNAHDQ